MTDLDLKNSEYIHNIIPFSLYRKFLKSSEMVYNELEIKNDMTKERMCWIRHDVVYEVFCFGLGYLHYLTMEKE